MRTRASLSTVLFALLITAGPSGCKRTSIDDNVPMSLQVESPSFRPGDDIPTQFTCSGVNISPALSWQSPPANTQSLALIVNDQDSTFHPFVHWILYNLSPDARALPEAVPTLEQLPDGTQQGWNENNTVGYWGPCPPGKSPHHYRFTLYALDSKLVVPSKADEKQLAKAMKGHILAAGQLTGRYQH